jgi:hypothetical protein
MDASDRDLYDSSSVLSNWENEGGAPAVMPQTGFRYASDDILRSFGQSVVSHWSELPHGLSKPCSGKLRFSMQEWTPD